MATLILRIAEIESKGRIEARFPLTRAWLEEALAETELTVPHDGASEKAGGDEVGVAEVVAHMAGQDVVVQGQLNVALEVPCARCNEPLALALDVAFTQLSSPRPDRHELPEELELTPDDLDRDYFSGDELALDAMVREALLLEVPMRPLHDEADCDPAVVAALADAAARRPKGALAGLAGLKDKLKS